MQSFSEKPLKPKGKKKRKQLITKKSVWWAWNSHQEKLIWAERPKTKQNLEPKKEREKGKGREQQKVDNQNPLSFFCLTSVDKVNQNSFAYPNPHPLIEFKLTLLLVRLNEHQLN